MLLGRRAVRAHGGHRRRAGPTHALALAIREAKKARETGEETVILTALCGHGHFDLPAYDAYLNGRMVDDEDVTDARLSHALETLPEVPVGRTACLRSVAT